MNYKDHLSQERKERDAIRQKNLQKLVARYGSIRALAIAISRSPNQIGETLNGRRPFGDTIAQHIETSLDLKPGYLDDSNATTPEINTNVRQLNKDEKKVTRIPLLSSVQAGSPLWRICG